MGNERSGRGGIEFAKFKRAERMLSGGAKPHEVARELGIDRKTAHKIAAGEHVFQLEQKQHECPVCRRVVDELPCMFCCVSPLETEARKVDPADLGEELFSRDETAAELYPELVKSVGEMGMIQAPLVTEDLRVILGGRRVRAAIEAGLPRILVLVVRANRHRQYDALLTEEFLRVERNPIERGRMFAACLADPDVRHTQKTLGERIGRSQSYVAQHVNLLGLPDYWRDLLSTRVLTTAHARLLLPHVDSPRLLAEVWRDFDTKDPPTVRAFRELIDAAAERLQTRVKSADPADCAEEGPLDEMLKRPRLSRRGPPTKEVKFKFAADAAENLMLRLDVIGEAEGCESREETLERLIDFYWQHKPDAGQAAALGLRKVA